MKLYYTYHDLMVQCQLKYNDINKTLSRCGVKGNHRKGGVQLTSQQFNKVKEYVKAQRVVYQSPVEVIRIVETYFIFESKLNIPD